MQRVIISGPSGDADATFVVGVNDEDFDPDTHVVVSNASCTTNCFVPMVKVVDDAFEIVSGLMTTVHTYTNDQNLLDLHAQGSAAGPGRGRQHRADLDRRGQGHSLVLESMRGASTGSRCGCRCRSGSITDFTAVVQGIPSVARGQRRLRRGGGQTAARPGAGVHRGAVVSSDIVGTPASCTFDAGLTMVQSINDELSLVKVDGWYDNEWGYSNRLVDLTVLVGG